MRGERVDNGAATTRSPLSMLPDLLCALRIGLGPAFVYTLRERPAVALAIAIAAALSDFVDGRLARRFGSPSRRGAALDVLADAVFVLCALGALAAAGIIAWTLPLAAALSLGGLAWSWSRRAQRVEAAPRGRADRLGHAAGITNYGVVLVGGALALEAAPAAWLRLASHAVALLNLAPLVLRWVQGRGSAGSGTVEDRQARSGRPGFVSRALRGVALAVLCLVAALVAAEVVLRSAAWSLPEPIHESPSLPADRRVDIAVYGDSTPYGLGAETSFPEQLALRTGLVVLNRSRPGLNSTQVARILEEDLQSYTPSILIVMAGVNDGWNLEDVSADLLGPAARWYQGLPRLRVMRLLAIWWEIGTRANALDDAKVSGWDQREETARLLGNDRLRKIIERSFASIRDTARAKGARLLFIGYQAEGWNWVADMAEDVARTSHGDSLVRTREIFLGDGRTMIQEDAFHPTTEGQKQIADRVLAELERRGWIETKG